ncbi:MAG: serpin family protein [bacterium]
MSSYFCRIAVSTALVACAACGAATEPNQAGTSAIPVRVALPRALTAGEQKIVNASNEFSFSLFRQLNASQKDSNIFASALGASMALGMTMTGASGSTYDQMRSTLGLSAAPDSEVRSSYKSLIALVNDLDPLADFRVGSSLWYRSDFSLNQSFVDAGLSAFGAQVSALDFASSTSAQTINSWVAAATTGRIPTIVEDVDATQSMVLVNAMYFRGLWRDRFDPIVTTGAVFHGAVGEQPAKVMYRVGLMRYFASRELEAVDLPFGNGAFALTVVLPRAGRSLDATAEMFQNGGWSQYTALQREVGMQLYMPRFRILWDRTLNDDLSALGMRAVFTKNGADFTRISPRGRELSLGAVRQKTLIDVTEDGTLPAATQTSPPANSPIFFPLIMFVDRSFLFVIHDRLSGTIVFIGKVVRM